MIEKYLDSEELKRLLSTLVVVVGCLIIAALFGMLVVPGLRNANRPETPTTVSPVTGETGWLDPAEFPVEAGRVIPPVDPETLLKPSAELTSSGKELYAQHCSTCHGEQGKGDGPAAGTMNPAPRNFTEQQGWVNGRGMADIYHTLSEGIQGGSMASFNYLTKKDRMSLVHYVQSLGGFEGSPSGSEAMQALSEELASPGEKTNNRIPVSMAIQKLESEFAVSTQPVIAEDDSGPGTALLRRVLMDPSRAAQALGTSGSWQSGPDALAQSVLMDTPGNGFRPAAATLTPNDWQAIYDALMKKMQTEAK
jgi:mono/diheme cytochrome c family protein